LVRIKAGSDAGHGHVAFFVDRSDRARPINLDDLEFLNRLLSDVLDVADAEQPFFKHHYNLEVSSPGIERPLTKKSHFEAAVGKTVRVKTDALDSVPRSVTGLLKDVSDEGIQVESAQKGETILVPFIRLKDANEVFDFSVLAPEKPKGRAKKSKGDK